MRKNGFKQICEILSRSDKNEFEDLLITAIYWFGESTNIPLFMNVKRNGKSEKMESFRENERFLKLFIALESLLIFGKEGITNNISERAAFLLGKNYKERKDIKAEIRDLYKKRSDIVHHGKCKNMTKKDIDILQTIVQKIILHLLKNKNKLNFESIDDFKLYFDKLKYS